MIFSPICGLICDDLKFFLSTYILKKMTNKKHVLTLWFYD
ncbi:MAG: hypothetical protein ACI8UC_000594 [Psychromonas sp.]|jgi:hypothetical protein